MKLVLSALAGLLLGITATVMMMTPHLISEQEAETRFLAEARKYFDEQLPVRREEI